MKKLALIALTFISAPLFALPVGNPSEASLFCQGLFDPSDSCCWDSYSFRTGFYGDYVFNRHLSCRNDSETHHKKELDHSRIDTNAAFVALNFWNRLDLFGTLGQSNLWLEGNISTFSPFVQLLDPASVGTRISMETSDAFSWSLGSRLTLWGYGNTCLGLEGQYFRTCPRVKTVTFASSVTDNPSGTKPYLLSEYSEWQIGLGLSHRIKMFLPYMAVKWSGSRLHFRNTNIDDLFVFPSVESGGLLLPAAIITLNDMENKKCWGYVVGCTLVDHERAALTVEGRFADEKAFYLNGQVRF